jgi:xylulokinase
MPLPRLAWPGEIIGTIHSQAARETGLAVGTPVVAGTIDAFTEAFSVGVRDPGDLMIMNGSTMFLIQVLADYHVPLLCGPPPEPSRTPTC